MLPFLLNFLHYMEVIIFRPWLF